MRTSRWTSVIVGLSVVSLAACSSDRSSGIASTDTAAPELFSVGSAAVSGALKATNQKTKLFETIPRLQARLQRLGIRQNIINSPYDLTNNGGPVVTHSTEWNVYINCPTAPSCWSTGNLTPAVFLRDFDRSSMIQIANQYLHEDAFGLFRQVNELATSFTFPVDTADKTPTANANDIVSVLVGAVNFTRQVGFANEYHLFFPQGTNVCINSTTCYSPNNPSTFVFCAFHSSIDLGPNAHVLFSVEPYQFVPGCVMPQQTRVIDGTASTLSHEFTETITDPDGDAWFNDLTGNEIGDLCFAFRNPERVNTHTYVIQEEYSNTVHACTDGAF
jgi:hypothetical protein